jgi:Tfp pilus assembly protein PilX
MSQPQKGAALIETTIVMVAFTFAVVAVLSSAVDAGRRAAENISATAAVRDLQLAAERIVADHRTLGHAAVTQARYQSGAGTLPTTSPGMLRTVSIAAGHSACTTAGVTGCIVVSIAIAGVSAPTSALAQASLVLADHP